LTLCYKDLVKLPMQVLTMQFTFYPPIAPMLCRHLVVMSALACALGVHARGLQSEPTVSRLADTDTTQEDLLVQQKRREVLRQATRERLDDASAPTRQLTTQERAELRQQLQQQRRELLKP
jgi:hypothetical protein